MLLHIQSNHWGKALEPIFGQIKPTYDTTAFIQPLIYHKQQQQQNISF